MNARITHGVSVLLALAVLLVYGPSIAEAQNDPAHQQFLFAYKLLQRGDRAEAAAEFDAYLRRYPEAPKRGDALYYRALLDRQAGDSDAVVERLSGERRLNPQLVPAYAVDLLLGQALHDLERHGEALAVLSRIDTATLGDTQQPLAASVRYLRGLAARGAGEAEIAAQELKAAATLAVSPAVRGRALLDLARVHEQRGDAPAARRALADVLAFDDPETPAEVLAEAARRAGDLAYAAGEHDAAARHYDRVIREHSAGSHYGAAVVGKLWALYAADRDGAVIEAYGAFQETLPLDDRVAATYLAGSAQQRLGKHEQTVALLEPVARGRAGAGLGERVLYRLAVSYHALDQHGRVAETVARLKEFYPDSELLVDAEFLRADSTVRQGGAAEGAAELTRFIRQGPASPYYKQALRQRAELYAGQGKADAALADFGAYLDALSEQGEPVDVAAEMPVVLRYAELLVQAGRAEEAVVQLHAATETLDEESRDGRPHPALEQEAMFRLAGAQTRAGDHDAALVTLDTLRREHPVHPFVGEAVLKRGALLRRLGRDREALEAWIAAADTAELPPTQRALALRAAAGVYRAAQRDTDAAVTLRRAAALVGADALGNEELLWLSREVLGSVSSKEADDLLSVRSWLAVLDAAGRDVSPAQRAERLYLGGRLALKQGDLGDAEDAFARVIALGEGFDLDAQLGFAEVLERRGEPDAARREYQLLATSEETTVAAEAMLRYGLLRKQEAAALRRQGNDRAASDALADARRLIKKMTLLYLDAGPVQPTPQRGLVELAEIAEALDEPDIALREYAELAEHFPDTPWGKYAAAVLAERRDNRPDDALAILTRLDRDELPSALRSRVDAMRERLEAAR